MKLTELHPRWVTFLSRPADGIISPRNGISFDCPHCKAQRLVIHFQPMIDPDNLLALGITTPIVDERKTWTRASGDTFDTLTLSPSVDASFAGHWHGFITNGEVSP